MAPNGALGICCFMSWKTELALPLEDPPNLFCAVTLGAFCFFCFLVFWFRCTRFALLVDWLRFRFLVLCVK